MIAKNNITKGIVSPNTNAKLVELEDYGQAVVPCDDVTS